MGKCTQRERAKDASAAIYLTLVSIIQSLALGYLVSSLQLERFNRLFVDTESVVYGLQWVANLQVIILTWHEYVIGTLCFRWVIDYLDSLIPFFFGMSQYFLIVSTNQGEPSIWFWGIAIFSLIALGAYANQYFKVKHEGENQEIFNATKGHQLMTLRIIAASIIIFILEGLVASWRRDNLVLLTALLSLPNIIMLAFAIRTHVVYRRILHSDKVA